MSTKVPNRATKRLPLRFTLMAAAAGLALAAGSPARAAVEEGYDPSAAPIPTTWYGPADPAAIRADRDYIAGMRPHHAGALTMAQEYLTDPQARSPVLRRLAEAIVRNQSFEIGLLDEVARNLDRPPVVLNLGVVRLAVQPMATEGLGQMQRFIRSPIPSPLAALSAPGAVTARDVQFAKGMTIHHQAALEMARAYHANPDARNQFLGLMNVDIITDQSQEIALMRSVIATYPGDPNAVRVDASMIHGMEGMRHGGGHGAHGGTAMPQPEAAPPVARPAAPRPQRPTTATPAARRVRPAHDGHGTLAQDEHAHHH
jgi:uncharacterized protein (DUF305 family)